MRRNRKKIVVKAVVAFIFLIILAILVTSYPPERFYLPLFFVLIFATCYFFIGLFLRFNLTIAIGIVGYLILRYFHMDNNLNLILLLALMTTTGIYQRK